MECLVFQAFYLLPTRTALAQHRSTTGESSSWAGPIDFGRDDSFMGALQIRQPGD